MHLKVVLLNDRTWPDLIQQFIFDHHAIGRLISAISTSKARAPSLVGLLSTSTCSAAVWMTKRLKGRSFEAVEEGALRDNTLLFQLSKSSFSLRQAH